VRWKGPWFKLEQTKLLDACLVELSKDDYASAIVMLTKKDIFGN
jgi:hypothetical protein